MNDQNQDPVQQELAAQLEQAEATSAAAGLAPAVEPTPAAPEPEPRHTHPTSLFSIQSFFTVVVLSIFVITFIVQAFQVPSGSMENTLLIGDFLLVDKLHFAGQAGSGSLLPYGTIKRGDVVVFYFPVDASQFLVKRVIGLPGDHIRLRDKAVYVNGQRLQESYAIHAQRATDGYRDNFPAQRGNSHDIDRRWRYEMSRYVNDGEVVVPADQYFVMGDNRDNSLDSRYWGFVPRVNIVGRPLVIYLSVKGSEPDGSNDKLIHSGQTLAHLLQLARWDRMFRLVR